MTRPRTAIAVLIDNLTAEYNAQVLQSIEAAATRHRVDLLVFAGQRIGAPSLAESAQNSVYSLISPDVADGVIVVSSTLGHFCKHDELVALCRSYAPLPVVSIGVELDGIPSLVVDNAGGMALGVDHLIAAHECRRIAVIAGPPDSTESEQRLAGCRDALEKRHIEFDPQLVVHGEFTVETGASAMQELLGRKVAFDAVVAANDNMALGALEVLNAQGFNVPRDVVLCGFDDVSIAHIAKPSLSSLRQPIRWLGAQAVETIARQLASEDVAMCRSAATELVRRESCGCGYQLRLSTRPAGKEYPTLIDALADREMDLRKMLGEAVAVASETLGDWPERLLDGLQQELLGVEGRFMTALEYVLEQAEAAGASLDEFQRVVSLLRAELRSLRVQDRVGPRQAERLWHTARVVIGAASIRAQGRQRMQSETASFLLGRSSQRLSTSLSLPLLREALADELPRMGIRRAAVSLYTDSSARQLKSLFVMVEGRQEPPPDGPFPARQVAPLPALLSTESRSSVVLPLTFDTNQLGVAVLATSATASMYEPLRQQVASAVKGAALHREVIQQVAARERLEQERLREESRVAAHIQTSMTPSVTHVPGLELSASMLPAAEAGGDYYDVLPTEDGAWLAIGDVAGHGLGSGMIMLMIQSIVSALARLRPEVTPKGMITVLNEALYDNVRYRLRRNEHATLTVMRYRRDGRVVMCGAHEDVVVWRARTGKCEVMPTPGFWVGAVPNIGQLSTEASFELEHGDLMVLHTDGLTEARNAHHHQYGLERLVALVEELADRSVADVRDRILRAVEEWCASFDDDRTLVVARYRVH